MNLYSVAGTVVGRLHARAGRNNQDAWGTRVGGTKERPVFAAAVLDGCGSGADSEVGAKLAAELLLSALVKHAETGRPFNKTGLRKIKNEILKAINNVLRYLVPGGAHEDLKETIARYFLFTMVCVVVVDDEATFLRLGDGVVIINGHVIRLESEVANQPDYLCYDLLGYPGERALEVVEHMPFANLKSAVIATDGLGGWIDRPDATIPGTTSMVGPVDRLWCDPELLDPAALNKLLRAMNRDVYDPDGAIRVGGRLRDDTTLVHIINMGDGDEDETAGTTATLDTTKPIEEPDGDEDEEWWLL